MIDDDLHERGKDERERERCSHQRLFDDDHDNKNCNRCPKNTHNHNNTRSEVFHVFILLLLLHNFILVLHMSIFAFKFLS